MKFAHGNKSASATKRGPGRYHKNGHQKMSKASPAFNPLIGARPPAGAITGTWHTGGAQRDAIKAAGGFRQWKRARMAPLRAARDAAHLTVPA